MPRTAILLALVTLVAVTAASPQQGQAPDYGNSSYNTTITTQPPPTPTSTTTSAVAVSSALAARGVGQRQIDSVLPLPFGPEANPPLLPPSLESVIPRDGSNGAVSQEFSNLNGAHTLALVPIKPYEAFPTSAPSAQPKATIVALGTPADLRNLETAAAAAPTSPAQDVPLSDTITFDRRGLSAIDDLGSITSLNVDAVTSYAAPHSLSANIGFIRQFSSVEVEKPHAFAFVPSSVRSAPHLAPSEVVPAPDKTEAFPPIAPTPHPSPHYVDRPQPDAYAPTGTPTRRSLNVRISKLNRLGVDEFSDSVEEIYRTHDLRM